MKEYEHFVERCNKAVVTDRLKELQIHGWVLVSVVPDGVIRELYLKRDKW